MDLVTGWGAGRECVFAVRVAQGEARAHQDGHFIQGSMSEHSRQQVGPSTESWGCWFILRLGGPASVHSPSCLGGAPPSALLQ